MNRIVPWLSVVLYIGAIWVLSIQTPAQLSALTWLPNDKLMHFIEFVILGLLLAWASVRSWQWSKPIMQLLLAIVVGMTLAALDEFHQSFVPGRHSDITDWLADVLGITAGALVTWWFLSNGRSRADVPRTSG